MIDPNELDDEIISAVSQNREWDESKINIEKADKE